MLGDDDHQNVHTLAVNVDKLQALYGHLQHAAEVSTSPAALAQVQRSCVITTGRTGRRPAAAGNPVVGRETRPPGVSKCRRPWPPGPHFPRPSTVKELQGFFGLVNFYRRFIPAVATIFKPLTDSRAEQIVWQPQMEKSFHDIKEALAEVTMLAHPLSHAHLSIAVDSSASHVGACLQQRRPGGTAWEPLGFFSRKLEPAQVKYSAFDCELLACYLGIRQFRYMLVGRHFTIFTDHKPLTFALKRSSDPWTARQCRQLAFVAECTFDIQHVAGKDNVVADALSRQSSNYELMNYWCILSL
jgi:hypothetical protein